mgnify:FL=1
MIHSPFVEVRKPIARSEKLKQLSKEALVDNFSTNYSMNICAEKYEKLYYV